MLRVILLMILVVIVARTFWRVMDGLIEGISGRSRSATATPVAQSTRLVRDPVCGTWVLPKDELSLTTGRRQVYFCSTTCRDHYRSQSA